MQSSKYWLMKAEPDSRVVKGKDVKFSVDDFESVKVTPWEGVRSFEARNLMKEMKSGENVLFYHSNCKIPGIAAFAKVSREAYPDYTAWDPKHPYYDEKTDPENPKWFMVDVTLVSRAKHFIPLALLRYIAALSPPELPSDLEYIGENGVKAIKEMALVSRGRLSVQRVNEEAWGVIELMADKGGWDNIDFGKGKQKLVKADGVPTKTRGNGRGKNKQNDELGDAEANIAEGGFKETNTPVTGQKRKTTETAEGGSPPLRRSTRSKR